MQVRRYTTSELTLPRPGGRAAAPGRRARGRHRARAAHPAGAPPRPGQRHPGERAPGGACPARRHGALRQHRHARMGRRPHPGAAGKRVAY